MIMYGPSNHLIMLTARRLLIRRYAAIALYGVVSLLLVLVSIYMSHRIYVCLFRYAMERGRGSSGLRGDDVNDPRHDDEALTPLFEIKGWNRRTPSGNQIRNRLAEYSKKAGRDLKMDLSAANDDY